MGALPCPPWFSPRQVLPTLARSAAAALSWRRAHTWLASAAPLAIGALLHGACTLIYFQGSPKHPFEPATVRTPQATFRSRQIGTRGMSVGKGIALHGRQIGQAVRNRRPVWIDTRSRQRA